MSFCPRVVSFYTRNTPYEKEAEGLAKSCDRLRMPHLIEGVSLTSDWHENTLYKPTFIQEKLKQYNEPLLWVDCDGRFRKRPVFSSSLECDLAVYTNQMVEKDDWRRFRSSCFLICPTSGGMQFADLWMRRVLEKGHRRIQNSDQEALVSVLNENDNFIIAPLPLGYVYISDLDPEPEAVVIQHFQASRLYQNQLQRSVPCDSEKIHFLKEMQNRGISAEELMHLSILSDLA